MNNTKKELLMKDSTFYLIAEILKRYKNNHSNITNTLEWFIDEFSYKLEDNFRFDEKSFRNYIYEEPIEICQNCGKSVARGSGLFVNRIVDFDDYKCRMEKGCPFPEGDFICQECEEKLMEDNYILGLEQPSEKGKRVSEFCVFKDRKYGRCMWFQEKRYCKDIGICPIDYNERHTELSSGMRSYNRNHKMEITRKELDIHIEALKKFFADLDIRLKKLEKEISK